jgi:putative ABC transport system permease protein
MRTREDARGPGAQGRVRATLRVALGGLWLAVRALASRAGLTLALTALTAFAVGVAAAGAMYLRAAGESLLQDRLAATSPFSAGLLVERTVSSGTEAARLRQLVRDDPRLAVPALAPPVFGLESEGFLTYSRPGDSGGGPRARIAAREGLCGHLRLRTGRCPEAGAQGQRIQAAVSPTMARRLGLRPGSRLEATTLRGEPVAPGLVVTGIYEPTPADPWWGLRAYFPPPPERGAGSDPPIDAVLVDHTALLRELDRSLARSLSVSAERALDPGRVHLSNAGALVGALTQVRREAWASAGGTRVESRLSFLVDQAGLDRRALTTPVLLATVQLVAVAMLMLLVVARMAADARAGEIALAKLRGASSRQAFLLATYELTLVVLVAFPLALAVGWAGTSVLARVQLRPGVPVGITPPALGVAVGVSLAALAAAALAGAGHVRRRTLELWRRRRPAPGTQRGLALELVLLAAATLGMVSLRLGGPRQGGGWDPVALLAPTLAVLAGGLLAARALPALAGGLMRANAGSRSLAPYLAARQVARPSGAALRVVVLLTAAFGLVAFAMTVRQDQRRNHHDRAWTEVGAARALQVRLPPGTPGERIAAAADPGGRQLLPGLRTGASVAFSGTPFTLLGVDPDRYGRVAFWREDFARQPLGRLLAPLRPPARIPAPELGPAEEIEIRLAAGSMARSAPPELTAELLGRDGRIIQVLLGPVRPGRHAYRAVVSLGGAASTESYRLLRVRLDESEELAGVAGVYRFEAVRARRDGGWRPVVGFDPGRWYVRSTQGRALPTTAAAGSGALVLALPRDPETGVTVSSAAVPEELPAVVTTGLLEDTGQAVGGVVAVRDAQGTLLKLKVTGVARALPGTDGAVVAALVDLGGLLRYGRDTRLAGRAHLWAAAGPEADAAVGRLEGLGVETEQDLTAAQRQAELGRQAPALALLLLVLGAAAAAVLATGGVMLYLYLDGRRRRFELAVLDALGARHRDLWVPLALEHTVLVGWGVLAGGAVGLATALVALPAVPQFLDPPRVPPALHLPDWPVLGVGAGLALALIAAGLSVVVAGLVRAARPALLREEVL